MFSLMAYSRICIVVQISCVKKGVVQICYHIFLKNIFVNNVNWFQIATQQYK
jgi:hypothetical protein